MELKLIKIYFTLFITGLFPAQSFRVFYDMKYKTDSTSSEFISKNMVLDYNVDNSVFYSYKLYKSDSTIVSNEPLNKITKTFSRDYLFFVKKDLKKEKVNRYYSILLDLFDVSDKLPKFNWKLSKDSKVIGQMKCQKATTSYKGREWIAWFTTEVPISDGPYIFNGLPGLIVALNDTKNNYEFNLIKIQKGSENLYGRYPNLIKSIPVAMNQLNKAYVDYYNDPYKEAKAGKVKMKFVDETGKPVVPNFNELTKQKQLIIRKNNNPIELTEAIKYSE
ncbi:GLPGLI family protein [Elizabethkingia meningoseptica]|uniref:GLPGLI family protein n=1 Tax=Elizabethkingia meningoseptica TaxID=238 RepID=UPI0023B01595|nr:GLPGLI family protein [Elizabethkingia meningoseptica]MDE5436975.1 GLPGLI family protein [Elizabethkingia meningoseptica]MDE5449428.1 GLPGLI family protein [Elizabethkingia meningoseptica]MDE5508998.1 GLPGLI family protein [Elizabethkingia meningoseptica]MDE5514515.1 GLPGLI family protein [Elizabethkingia meningoseptica]MDE5525161.1 GLPGLI family protein [Elizabethkingia meningoseptica]